MLTDVGSSLTIVFDFVGKPVCQLLRRAAGQPALHGTELQALLLERNSHGLLKATHGHSSTPTSHGSAADLVARQIIAHFSDGSLVGDGHSTAFVYALWFRNDSLCANLEIDVEIYAGRLDETTSRANMVSIFSGPLEALVPDLEQQTYDDLKDCLPNDSAEVAKSLKGIFDVSLSPDNEADQGSVIHPASVLNETQPSSNEGQKLNAVQLVFTAEERQRLLQRLLDSAAASNRVLDTQSSPSRAKDADRVDRSAANEAERVSKEDDGRFPVHGTAACILGGIGHWSVLLRRQADLKEVWTFRCELCNFQFRHSCSHGTISPVSEYARQKRHEHDSSTHCESVSAQREAEETLTPDRLRERKTRNASATETKIADDRRIPVDILMKRPIHMRLVSGFKALKREFD